MTSLLDKLNLRPQEKRWVVMAAAVLFVLLQFWLVWPHFKEWQLTKDALEKANRTLVTYRSMFAQTNDYRAKLEQLQNQNNTGLLTEDQVGTLLIRRITDQARESKVNYREIRVRKSGVPAKPNEFFEEQTLDLPFNPTGDKELIDFLLAIGNSDLMVRVKALDLNPAGSQLAGNMTLVASFQKKGSVNPPPVKPAGGLSSNRP
jgi:hypothetical protein